MVLEYLVWARGKRARWKTNASRPPGPSILLANVCSIDNKLDYCSPLVEFVTVKCRPFYLPWEFTAVIIMGVYILPSANATNVLAELYGPISELQSTRPDGLFTVGSNFNHANLKNKKILPKFYQYVDCNQRRQHTRLCLLKHPRCPRCTPTPLGAIRSHQCYANSCIPTSNQASKSNRLEDKDLAQWGYVKFYCY